MIDNSERSQCCERDHNRDGNCDIHSAPGVLRTEAFRTSKNQSPVVSIQDGMFLSTDGAGFFARPATDDEKLFWAEIVRLREEHESDLERMERAAEAIERLTRIVNEHCQPPTTALAMAYAERDRLRAALEKISKHRLRGHKTQAALLAEEALSGEPNSAHETSHEWLPNAVGSFTCDCCGSVATSNPAAPCTGRDSTLKATGEPT